MLLNNTKVNAVAWASPGEEGGGGGGGAACIFLKLALHTIVVVLIANILTKIICMHVSQLNCLYCMNLGDNTA